MIVFAIFMLLVTYGDNVLGGSPQCTSGYRSIEKINDWATQTKMNLDLHPHQQLYPTINFTCSGNLTRWIMKGQSELRVRQDMNFVYPELQVWRLDANLNYHKVGSSIIDIQPQNRLTHIYSFRPDPPISFYRGDIFGIWEGTNNHANTREVDNIRQVQVSGFNYEASSPQTSFPGGSQRGLGRPLVAVETSPPGCNTFIDLETLSAHSTRGSCCNYVYYLHIIPQMRFSCNGNITSWSVGASWVQSNDANVIPELQVWRNVLGTGNAYSRVASNRLNPIPPRNTNINGGYFKKRVFSNNFYPPIAVQHGDILGLMLSPSGQLNVQMIEFPDISLPRNFIFTSASNFSDMLSIDLDGTSWSSIEFLQPLISLAMSAESSTTETTETESGQTSTMPSTHTTMPPLQTSSHQPFTSTNFSPVTNAITLTQQSQPTSHTNMDIVNPTNVTVASTTLLESKHIFGIVITAIIVIVLCLVLAISIIGLSLFVKSVARRNRGHDQFVETFIQTGNNEAYRSRTMLLAESNRNTVENLTHDQQSNCISTRRNMAYQTSCAGHGHSMHLETDLHWLQT